MLRPEDVVHACKYVATGLVIRHLLRIIFLSYNTRGIGVGLWRTLLCENELLVLTYQHDINV